MSETSASVATTDFPVNAEAALSGGNTLTVAALNYPTGDVLAFTGTATASTNNFHSPMFEGNMQVSAQDILGKYANAAFSISFIDVGDATNVVISFSASGVFLGSIKQEVSEGSFTDISGSGTFTQA